MTTKVVQIEEMKDTQSDNKALQEWKNKLAKKKPVPNNDIKNLNYRIQQDTEGSEPVFDDDIPMAEPPKHPKKHFTNTKTRNVLRTKLDAYETRLRNLEIARPIPRSIGPNALAKVFVVPSMKETYQNKKKKKTAGVWLCKAGRIWAVVVDEGYNNE